VHLTLGSLRKSQAVSYALAFFWLDGFAVPAPAQVTQTVETVEKVEDFNNQIHKPGFYMKEDPMAKYKPSNENQMIMLPVSLQDQLVPGTLEHTINRLVDENINLSVFDERYKNDETGAAAIHPKILLKVILLAYAKGMISSRQIERACHENIIFIALSYGYAPDHSTIASFISSMQNEISSIFSDILLAVKNWNCWVAHTSASTG